MLNKNGKNGYPYFVPKLRGKAFSFLPLNIMLAVVLSCMVFIMLSYVPSIATVLRVFIIS